MMAPKYPQLGKSEESWVLKEKDNTLDEEWISLMKEAYQLGLSIVEVKEFIYLNQKEPVYK